MKNFIKIIILGMCFQGLFALGPIGCGGGSENATSSEQQTPTDNSSPTQHDTRDFDINVRLSDSEDRKSVV